ncbi:hypothetical protein [Neisseria meningitidis]|uniref:hypothetical protein n=1 Tax=Neisseria meningitidis TaxID=487 RepID=UPI0002D95C26|nr:hypothetical protein [Neisseria meningitidis]
MCSDTARVKPFLSSGLSDRAVFYSGLTKTSTALPRLAVLFVLSAASSPCPDLNLIHYT